jgi:hypothetical protein
MLFRGYSAKTFLMLTLQSLKRGFPAVWVFHAVVHVAPPVPARLRSACLGNGLCQAG